MHLNSNIAYLMESINNSSRKSRDQKFFEFFVILQKEYIVAELRKKIYPDASGKAKSQEIMDGKKKKIFDIAFKNSIKTIFPDMKVGVTSLYDEELRIRLYKEVYNDKGMPNFIYRDDHQKSLLAEKDRKCYFMLGSEVRIEEGIGIILEVYFDKCTCVVGIGIKRISKSLDEVSRIL